MAWASLNKNLEEKRNIFAKIIIYLLKLRGVNFLDNYGMYRSHLQALHIQFLLRRKRTGQATVHANSNASYGVQGDVPEHHPASHYLALQD